MKVCVVGLWHLGTVTAACLASAGHQVIGLDFEEATVKRLQAGQPPLYEPDLEELVRKGQAEGRLGFSTDIADSLYGSEVIWVAFDTPVDEEDCADVDFVLNRVVQLFPYLSAGAVVLISSQLPVGSTGRLERQYALKFPDKPVTFGYSPENLRLGKAIRSFTQPDRVVVGVRNEAARERVQDLLRTFSDHIEWMSVESAEMTKHALNAYLATSIAFINEVAELCAQVGADAREVELGLKSDTRIGPRSYLTPGAAFAGGTLARDIQFLAQIGAAHHQSTVLLSAVRESNEAHRLWVRRRLQALLGDLRGERVAILGLTYKPGTDTLRRSGSVELCEWLSQQGTVVHTHDPAVKRLPEQLAEKFALHSTPIAALSEASAMVVATEWPEYRSLTAETILSAMRKPLVIDPNGFLLTTLGNDQRIRYVTVGKAQI
jgi:UDPglucose 6-dehydrogenase